MKTSLLAINGHAPFYPSDILKVANRAHDLAYGIREKHMAAVVAVAKTLPEDKDMLEKWKLGEDC